MAATPSRYALPCVPSEATLTRFVVPEVRSRTNTSVLPFVSPETRPEAPDTNAT